MVMVKHPKQKWHIHYQVQSGQGPGIQIELYQQILLQLTNGILMILMLEIV